MKWLQVFAMVTAGALAGMFLGGMFGFASGKLAPDFFRRIIPWEDVEPVGVATFFGATAGVLLGGALACFGLLLQLVLQWRHRPGRSD
jgi:H+/Cl- antiporter ClcA